MSSPLLSRQASEGPVLDATALSCERDWRVLFENLDVQVRPGEMLRVTGPNGCGKTSLLRLLAGLATPASGNVQITSDADDQSPLLWIGHASGIRGALTAEENLSWLCALNRPATTAQIHQALAIVGLKGYEDVPCHSLSAGQQRRVALARLHLSPPRLWILDEPFTALDAQGTAELEGWLKQHCDGGGLVVLTTHHLLNDRPEHYRELALGQRAA